MALTTLIRGDDWKFTFTVLTPAGVAKDITGGSIWLTMKDAASVGQPDSAAVFQLSDLDIQAADHPDNDVVNGIVVLAARHDTVGASPPSNTLVAAGKYNYDVQYQDAGAGGAITTIESGSVTVANQITEAAPS